MKSSAKRSYRQYCGLARCLDRIGERWTLLIVRNLLLGPRRYGDLLAELPGITTNLLAKRLRELEAMGVVERVEKPPPVAATLYALTEMGAALEPALLELGRWGARFMREPRRDDTVNIGWGLISLKRRYRGGLDLVAELRMAERRFEVALTPIYMRVSERASEHAELVVSGSAESFRELFFAGASARRLVAAGALEPSDPKCFARLLCAFDGIAP